jgi:hypothetical protein
MCEDPICRLTDVIYNKRYEYSAKEDEITVKDLSSKLMLINSDMYNGVCLVDEFSTIDVDELLWCVIYRFGSLKEEAR